MGNGVFNQAKGHVSEFATRVLANDPPNSAFIFVLGLGAITDATLVDLDTLALVIADAGFTEALFTNYARVEIDDAGEGLTRTVDDTNNRVDIDVNDIVFTAAGNGANDILTRALFTYDADTLAGTDADIIPCTFHDFAVTTDGSDLTVQVTNFFRAS